MLDINKVGEQIALFRKERGLTQEALAQQLHISPQAVSKWENGHTLPETALLPALSKILECTIDSLLMPSKLQILEAVYTDGTTSYNITSRLNKYVEGDKLELLVNETTTMHPQASDKLWFLLIKYQTEAGTFYTCKKHGEALVISDETPGVQLSDKPMEIIDAYYGNNEYAYNAMQKIKHYEFFKWDKYQANHEAFPSNPMVTGPEYLTIIYLNDSGIHIAICGEKESLVITPDGKSLYREPAIAESWQIPGIEALQWQKGMDCSWAGALSVALRATGHMKDMSLEDAYIKVMGVSGACYRLAFSSPTWDYSSVDGLVAFDYATPAYKAFGYTPIFANRVDKKQREDEREKILRSLRHKRPVLAINLRVAPEWGVITGYEDNGKTLLCRTYYDKDIIEKEFGGADRYLEVDNWPFIITYFGNDSEAPTDEANLINSLRVMAECVNIPNNGGYSMGYKAYETWAADLRNEERFSVNEETLWRLYSVNHFCMMALVDARRCAWQYLAQCTGMYDGQKRELLTHIAENYKIIYEMMMDIFGQLMDACPTDASKVKKLWHQQLRWAQAQAFDQACILEKEIETLGSAFLAGI